MQKRKFNQISRRAFLVGDAVTVANISLADWLAAQGPVDRPKRSDVGSEAGKRMLLLYRKAAAEMNDTGKWPSYHPFNWNFQANIHDYPTNTNVDKIFD